jgi:hypothetical protein
LGAVRISPKAKTLTLDVVLPAGTKLNLAGPSNLKASSADVKTVEVGAFNGAMKDAKVSVPIAVKPGQTTLTLDADVYYCSKANEGLCYFKSARLRLPVEVAEDGSTVPVVEYRVSK